MRINAKQLFTPDYLEGEFCLDIEDGFIKEIKKGFCEDAIDAKNFYVAPGFVDVHIHGFMGHDISEGTVTALNKISESLLKTGVTSYLPTFVSMPLERLKEILRTLTPFLTKVKGAVPIGFHIEGAFINKEKHGAMDENYFVTPSIEIVDELLNSGKVKMFTVAPEITNVIDVIRYLAKKGVIVSLGHTNTDYETAALAFVNGATSVTHLFNAMTQFHHRNPGLIGASFTLPFYLQFIADGVHTKEEIIKMMRLVKERVVLITDCTQAGGMKEGRYLLGALEIYSNGKYVSLKDGTLAGSVLTMDVGVKNLVKYGGFSLEDAIKSATKIPSESIREPNIGVIRAGADADIVLLDENLSVRGTIVKGNFLFDGR